MLTTSRVEAILDLIKKEYSYMGDKPIYIFIKDGNEWCAESTDSYYMLNLEENLYNLDFSNFFYRYLAKEFKFDLTWAKVDYQSTITALALLHEIGHIKQTMLNGIDRNYVEKMNKEYSNYRIQSSLMDEKERRVAYRQVSYEYSADEFAVEIFSKYAIKILAILNGTTQKEIKNKINMLRTKKCRAK